MFWCSIVVLGLLSTVAHEFGHAFAMRESAVRIERISLMGAPYFGTYVLPLRLKSFPETELVVHPLLIGAYVKPNEDDISKTSVRDRIFILVAGPLANLIFAFVLAGCAIGTVIFRKILPHAMFEVLFTALGVGAVISGAFCAMNLLPLMPLDGGQITMEFLPDGWKNTYTFVSFAILGLIALMPPPHLVKKIWNTARRYIS